MKKVALILGVVLVVLCGIGSFAMKSMNEAKKKAEEAKKSTVVITRGDIVASVVESGIIDAVKSVEVKSRASGRLARLIVEEGDIVQAGQLIAVIDPKETQLQVESNQAQLAGAQSATARTGVEIEQRRITAKAAYDQAILRVAQLRDELRIQPTLTNSAITSARTALAVAKQERERLINNLQPNARTASESALREAQANFENTNFELTRQRELLARGYVAQRNVENAQLNVDLARTRLDSAKDNLSRIDAQFRLERAKADEEVRRAQSDVDRAGANSIDNVNKRREYQTAVNEMQKAKAALRDVEALRYSKAQSQSTVRQISSTLRESQRQLGETQIRAPLSGIVTKKFMQEGELVASLSSFSSGTPIVRIEDRRSLRVKLDINEIDVAKLRQGMEATIKVDAIPDATYRGTLRKIAPASKSLGAAAGQATSADNVVKYEVEIWLNGTDSRLRSGMSATCTLETLRKNDVLYAPVEYVGKDDKGSFIEIAPDPKNPNAKAEKRYVKLGAATGSRVEILEGAAEGVQLKRPAYTGPARKGMMQAGPEEE